MATNNIDHNHMDRMAFRIFSVNHICFKGYSFMPVKLEQRKPAKFDEAKVAQNVNLVLSTIRYFGASGTKLKFSWILSVIVNRIPCI